MPSSSNGQQQHLYLSDFDGTLLGADGTLSSNSEDLLNQAIDLGAHFSGATARGVPSALQILKNVRLSIPLIAKNGAALADPHTGEVIDAHYLDTELSAQLFKKITETYPQPHVHTIADGEERVYVGPNSTKAMDWYLEQRKQAGETRFHEVNHVGDYVGNRVTSFIVLDEYRAIVDFAERIRSEFGDSVKVFDLPELYKPEYGFLVINSPEACKAGGVDLLLRNRPDLVGLPLTVFGDELNDSEIFRRADRAIAPQNAVPEILDLADLVIPRNTEDSVATFVLDEVRKGTK